MSISRSALVAEKPSTPGSAVVFAHGVARHDLVAAVCDRRINEATLRDGRRSSPQQWVAAAAMALLFFACVASSAFAQATLRVGDPVELKISGVPAEEQAQVNNMYTVDANGSVNLPYINKVKAEGLTPAQLASSIEASYRSARIYTNPTITILMQPTARFVNVGGAVRTPSRVPFTEDMTLLTAINAAGGFNDFADQKRVRVLRGTDVKVYDVRQFRRDPSQDIKLQPGDRIEIPQSFF